MYNSELILFTEISPSKKVLDKIPYAIKVFPLDHLEGLMKRRLRNGHGETGLVKTEPKLVRRRVGVKS